MNISRSKTANIINRLIDLGYIEKENRTRGRGEKIPQELVRERLKNISYEHISCADNRLPREKVNSIWQKKNIDTVPYLISVLYDLLKHNKEELIKIEYGDNVSESSSGKEDSDELFI